MKKNIAIIIMLSAWIAPAAMAQNYPFPEFVHNAGLHKGYALACRLDQTDIANYERAVTRYAVSHWPEEFRREFQKRYKQAVDKAKNDRKRKLDDSFCRGIRTTLTFGAEYPDSPYTHEFLAKHDRAIAQLAEMKRKVDEATAKEARERAVEAANIKKRVSAVGTRICREAPGTRRNVVGTSFSQPVYGRAVSDTYYITGFTEAVGNDRIKVLVSAIQEASTGQYIEALPPNYTKGVHVWENFTSWRPC